MLLAAVVEAAEAVALDACTTPLREGVTASSASEFAVLLEAADNTGELRLLSTECGAIGAAAPVALAELSISPYVRRVVSDDW